MTYEPESLEIRTADGHGLGAELCEPEGRRALGTVVFAHPMFANKSVFARPRGAGVARLFLEAGWRTLAFDFRGHGESTFEGESFTPEEHPWSYDELVRLDLPTVVRGARDRWPESRLIVVGHSLGGHVALAAAGAGLIAPDALVVAASNVWMRHLESSRRIWLLKLATLAGMGALAKRHRYFPVRALRLGSDDEAAPYIEDFVGYGLRGRWRSRDGAVDYEASLPTIKTPTLSITSRGDRLYCRPASAERFLASMPSCTHHCIEHGDDGGKAPGHMGVITSGQSRGAWRAALTWLETLPT